MIQLDIYSDPICPWCYIGKAHLDRALTARADHPFHIEWQPFQLDMAMPAEGMDRRQYLVTKFGGQENALKMYRPIDAEARAAGLEINWAGIIRTPNTFDAHRLIHWAGIDGVQTLVVSALFRAYFQDGLDIGALDVLSGVAEHCGMDGAVVANLLAGTSDTQELQDREDQSRTIGITSVPTFIIGHQSVVSGAQKPEFWGEVLNDLAAAAKS